MKHIGFDWNPRWSEAIGPGHWPDADMLPIGPILQDYDKNSRTKFTEDEQYTMLTLWSIFRSPLMIGGEMTGFDEFTMKLITNERILGMHSDSRHAHQVWRKNVGGIEHVLWTSVSQNGGQYFAVFNTGEADSEIGVDFAALEMPAGKKEVCELWSGETCVAEGSISVKLNKHGAKAFLVK